MSLDTDHYLNRHLREIRNSVQDVADAIREQKQAPSSDVFTKDEYGYFLHLMYAQGHTARYYTQYGKTFNTEDIRRRLSHVSGLPIHNPDNPSTYGGVV